MHLFVVEEYPHLDAAPYYSSHSSSAYFDSWVATCEFVEGMRFIVSILTFFIHIPCSYQVCVMKFSNFLTLLRPIYIPYMCVYGKGSMKFIVQGIGIYSTRQSQILHLLIPRTAFYHKFLLSLSDLVAPPSNEDIRLCG